MSAEEQTERRHQEQRGPLAWRHVPHAKARRYTHMLSMLVRYCLFARPSARARQREAEAHVTALEVEPPFQGSLEV